MCTQCSLQHFLHAMYFRCYNNYMIEENDNYKVMFYFLSPNVLLLSIHPSIFFRLSGAGSRGQQSKQRCPDFPLPRHFLLPSRGIPRRSQVLDFKSSCVIKNRRKASNIKVLKFIDQNSALGCFSDKSLTKKQQPKAFSQDIYKICPRGSSFHWLS